MTPDANPSMAFWTRAGISLVIKKTKAEPSMVPASGMSKAVVLFPLGVAHRGQRLRLGMYYRF